VDDLSELGMRIFPNPVRDGLLRMEGIEPRITAIEVYTVNGQRVGGLVPTGQRQWQLKLPSTAATYLVVVRTKDKQFVERVVAY